jgi:hypothetical protein
MNKFLNNDKQVQSIPDDVLKTVFPYLLEVSEDVKKNSNKWVVLKNGETEDGVKWQMVLQDISLVSNLFYYLFIFTPDGGFYNCVIQSDTVLPPVFEKVWGLDYYDWIKVQATFLAWLEANNYKTFEIDEKPEGKFVYLVREKDALEKANKGEKYEILAVLAEVALKFKKENGTNENN